jgi:nicotinamidase-related amidase
MSAEAVSPGEGFPSTRELGWDQFLTERDRALLAATSWTKREPFGFGGKPAVVVIDDYYEVLGTERLPLFESLKRWPKSTGLDGWEAIDRTRELLVKARQLGIPVVHVTKSEGFQAPWGSRKPRTRPDGRTEEMDRLSAQIVEEVAPVDGELVIRKVTPSAFRGTPLQFWLTHHGIDTVLIAGESTSGCVRASAVDAASNRLRVGVVSDCCFDRLQASHWISLFDLNQKYADVVDSTEAIEYLEKLES